MAQVFAKHVGETHKLIPMAERCRRLRIERPSDMSVAAMGAILYGDVARVFQAGPGGLAAVREFKTILHRDRGTTQPTLQSCPEYPHIIRQHHADLYTENYSEAPPTDCQGSVIDVKRAQGRMPCRDTKTGFTSNAGMGPGGTTHIPHGASLHRSMSMDAPHQDPNSPLVVVQDLSLTQPCSS